MGQFGSKTSYIDGIMWPRLWCAGIWPLGHSHLQSLSLTSWKPGRHSQVMPPFAVSWQIWAQPWFLSMQFSPSGWRERERDALQSLKLITLRHSVQSLWCRSPLVTLKVASVSGAYFEKLRDPALGWTSPPKKLTSPNIQVRCLICIHNMITMLKNLSRNSRINVWMEQTQHLSMFCTRLVNKTSKKFFTSCLRSQRRKD